MEDPLLTVDEAATFLGLRPSTIRGMVQRKTIPVIRPAGKRVLRFRRSDLLRLRGEPIGTPPAAG
jgi:excisionase family DNA binding protein